MIEQFSDFKIGDLIVEHEHNYGRIIGFKFCKTINQILPLIQANNRTYFAHWDYLRKTQDLEQLNLFKPIAQGDPNEPPEGDFMETKKLKAITVQPPMSEMIAKGFKDIENRHIAYSSKTDGDLLIHAGKTYNHTQAQWIRDKIGIEPPSPEDCQMGGVVAIATVETTLESDSQWAMPNFNYYWNILKVKPIKFFPCRGQQGLFSLEIPNNLLEETQEEEAPFKIGDWTTTIFDAELIRVAIANGDKHNLKRLGRVVQVEGDKLVVRYLNGGEGIILISEATAIDYSDDFAEEPTIDKKWQGGFLPLEIPPQNNFSHQAQLQKIPINSIEIDDRCQPRNLQDQKICEKSQEAIKNYAGLKRQGVAFDPIEIILFDDRYILATGYHRLQADILNGETETWAYVRVGKLADAIAIGAIANGKQQHFNLSKKEQINQVYRLFEAFSLFSEQERIERQIQGILPRNTDQEIANVTGISRPKVLEIRKQLIETHGDDPQWSFLKGGKTLTKNGRVIDTSDIGKSNSEEPFSLPIEVPQPPEETENNPLIPDWLKRGMAVLVLDQDAPHQKGIALTSSEVGASVLFSHQEEPYYVRLPYLKPYCSVGDRMTLDSEEGEIIGIELEEITPDCYCYFLIDDSDESVQVRAIDLEPIILEEATSSEDLPNYEDEEKQPSAQEEAVEDWEDWSQQEEAEPLVHNFCTVSQLCEMLVESKKELSQAQLQWIISSLIPELEGEYISGIFKLLRTNLEKTPR